MILNPASRNMKQDFLLERYNLELKFWQIFAKHTTIKLNIQQLN